MARTQQAAVLPYVQNDTQPPVSITMMQPDEVTPVDLTGYTAVLAYRVSATRTVTKIAVFPAPTLGQFAFQWAAGDLDTPGQYQLQITLISAAGGRQSWENVWINVAAAKT